MVDVPRLMSTQHPDNATLPFFTAGDVIEGEDEIQEAYYVYSHLGCDEQMWDFEGKEGDEYAVKKLLAVRRVLRGPPVGDGRAADRSRPEPRRGGVRGEDPAGDPESIPRSFDAARRFAGEYGLETTAPIFEVIVPMVTDADQLNAVHEYYERFVTGKADEAVWDGRTVEEWVGSSIRRRSRSSR